MAGLAAVTGATGFVGNHLLNALDAAGWRVRALARRPQPPRASITWLNGDLANADALEALVVGADAVFHLAGAIKGLDAAAFDRANIHGTQALIAAMARMDSARLVHISTLAARLAHLSDYARSKAAAEDLVAASGLAWTIIRPPAVYGPGDTETLQLFKAAQGWLTPVPRPDQRLAIIHVHDLARAIVSAANPVMIGQKIEVGDGESYSMADLVQRLARATGGGGRALAVPRGLVELIAQAIQWRARRTGVAHVLSPAKVNELYHPNWTVADTTLTRRTGWTPQIVPEEGFADTMRWYREQGWMR